jgi:hypothetical protein
MEEQNRPSQLPSGYQTATHDIMPNGQGSAKTAVDNNLELFQKKGSTTCQQRHAVLASTVVRHPPGGPRHLHYCSTNVSQERQPTGTWPFPMFPSCSLHQPHMTNVTGLRIRNERLPATGLTRRRGGWRQATRAYSPRHQTSVTLRSAVLQGKWPACCALINGILANQRN